MILILLSPAFFPFVAKASQLPTQKSNWRNIGKLHGFCAISDCDKRRKTMGNNFFIQLVYFKTGLALNMLFYLSWIISLHQVVVFVSERCRQYLLLVSLLNRIIVVQVCDATKI
jgi:hypothetical protein